MNDSARRWGGYVCPDCRFVFRVPRDHDGTGLVCPSCRRLLKVPRTGDVPPPLLAEVRRVPSAADSIAAGQSDAGEATPESADGQPAGRVRLAEKQRVSKRRSSSSQGAGPHQSSWEHGTSGTQRFRRLDLNRMRWMLVAGVVLLGLIISGVVVMMKTAPSDDLVASGATNSGDTNLPPAGTLPSGNGQPTKRSDASILVEAESIAKDFLNARTIEELLPLVRNPDRARPRMEREYPANIVPATGMAEFNPGKVLMHLNPGVEVNVRTRSFEVRPLALVETPDGLRVDWESWVEWSDMPWTEFLDTKPTVPQAFRVVAKKVEYYNFEFSNDSKWRSFRLESRKGDQTMYGYVERGSELEARIQIPPEKKKAQLILKVRFPVGAPITSNQVLIEDVVQDGWLQHD